MSDFRYTQTGAVYPQDQYQDYYYYNRPNPNSDFVRNMYIISKMAEENPGVKYKYTSTTAVYL